MFGFDVYKRQRPAHDRYSARDPLRRSPPSYHSQPVLFVVVLTWSSSADMSFLSMKLLLLSCALACWVQCGVNAQDTCSMSNGGLTTFTNGAVPVSLPCKYHATTVKCQGYKIHVAPGQAYSHSQLYTDTLWVSVKKGGFYWKARTSLGKLLKNPGENPFTTKDSNLDSTSFQMVIEADSTDLSATLSTNDAQFTVRFYGYDSDISNSGWEITCPESEFKEKSVYPRSICGDNVGDALASRMSELGLPSQEATVIYDILDNQDITQMNPQCQLATDIFNGCSADRSQVITECQHLLTDSTLSTCLGSIPSDPMDAFNLCLQYKCTGDINPCQRLTALQLACPAMNVVQEQCASCGNTFTLTEGILVTPNYPNNYDDDLECGFLIEAPPNHIITVTFPVMNIEYHSTCYWDRLSIYNGSDNSTALLGEYCGTHTNVVTTSSTNTMYLHLYTDFCCNRQGFLAHYIMTPTV